MHLNYPFLRTYHVVRMCPYPAHFIFLFFFKHTKPIGIFTNLGNITIFNQVGYCFPCISYLTLETYVFILNGLDSVIMVCDGKLMLSLYDNNGLEKTHYRSATWNFLCLWLLAWQKTIYTSLLHYCKCHSSSYIPS